MPLSESNHSVKTGHVGQTGNACKKGAVCIFAKTPVLGKVKTRLEAELGKQGCLNLHKWLVEDRLSQFSIEQGLPYEVELHVTGNPQDHYWQALHERYRRPLFLQCGRSLGERMWRATQSSLQRKDWVILIGADCPDLDVAYVAKAVSALESGNEAVIGPADDGGYVLLGLRQPLEALFQRIDWGTSRVFEQTMAVIEKLNMRCTRLPQLKDLDVFDDYLYYRDRINS